MDVCAGEVWAAPAGLLLALGSSGLCFLSPSRQDSLKKKLGTGNWHFPNEHSLAQITKYKPGRGKVLPPNVASVLLLPFGWFQEQL